MNNIGYLGLGVMGYGMAVNLLKNCTESVCGYDVAQAACEKFRKAGGVVVKTPEELYRTCQILFLCLPSNELMKQTMEQIIETADQGTIVVDTGSTSPFIVKELHQRAKARGIFLLDAPVSGGESGASAGTLAVMCGGDREVFEKMRPYLSKIGRTVTYMGSSGSGSVAKLANNMMVGIHLVAVGEAYAFAKKAGIDPRTLFKAIRAGAAQSAVMDLKVPKILNRDFTASARIAVHYKDIENALEMGRSLDVELPLTEIVKAQMDWMDIHGLINEDQCALVKYYEDAMGVQVEP